MLAPGNECNILFVVRPNVKPNHTLCSTNADNDEAVGRPGEYTVKGEGDLEP